MDKMTTDNTPPLRNIEDMISFIRESLNALHHFSDEVSRIDEKVFQEANRGEFPSGKTVLGGTYHSHSGKQPLDVLNMVEGYIIATREVR